ncbi:MULTISPECIES: hypothetical protein [unclassified Acinetobacter]|uniref:hypothetical protein n=1 Tax=unclassified Acinetobacter TaxID=196816 RepID=UPI0015D33720|nr:MULTISPECIES: hypothetical protein [unclassified Acinetobacter]UUS62549.1 hypothetical protein MST17_16705 [Acinetobacter sp. YH16056_T]
MNNAEFFLLTKALGFSTAEEIHRYISIKKFRGYTNIKAVQTWIDAQNQQNKIIPADIVEHFIELHKYMISQTESDYYKKAKCLYIYESDQQMWEMLPHLKGLTLQYLINFYILLIMKYGNLKFRFYRKM